MKAILPVFDSTTKRPYYLQLYDYIKDAILTGNIQEGEKLPSLRSLSKSTGVSITTVEQCYNQLLVEGYIHSKAQSGYYVNEVFSHLRQDSDEADFIKNTTPLLHDMSSPEATPYYYDNACFDFNKWKKCMNKIITEAAPALFFAGNPIGEPELRREITRYLYMSRGVICSPEQIIIGAGTQQLTNQIATLLRKLSIENIALESPGFAPVRNIFRDRGFAISQVPVDNNGLRIQSLPANIRSAVYVAPSNHIFTGAVMPIGRRYELINWAVTNDSYIMEDDYDSELRYFGKPVPALKSLRDNNRVIYLGSFSSTLFAAVKISYAVLPHDMAELFSKMAQDYTQTCSKLEQLTLALFMENGFYQTHIKKLRKLYAQKLNLVMDVFSSSGCDFIDVRNTTSGNSLVLKVSSPKTSAQLKKDADDLGIPLMILDDSGLLALYYNHIPIEDIPSALNSLISKWQ